MQKAFAVLALIAVSLSSLGCEKTAEYQEGAAGHKIRVTVVVPDGTPDVYLTGNLPLLGPWDPAGLVMDGTDEVRTATVSAPEGHLFEYKFTLGSWDLEALNAEGRAYPNFQHTVDADAELQHVLPGFKQDSAEYLADTTGSGILGRLIYWRNVESEHLTESRHVEIWLPPGYEESDARYRVIYMHDGQNLFDPRLASTNTDWGVDEAMVKGTTEGLYDPAIVVGIWNTARRGEEYSPWHLGPDYARFIIEELMPRVNAEFRTLTGPENTFTIGSSMGGLISYYLIKEHPDVFGACGCVSSHFVFSGDQQQPYILTDIEAGETMPAGVRPFFDYGTEGLDRRYGPTHDAVRDWLVSQGFKEGADFKMQEYEGAGHTEASWRARIGDQLAWLLAAR